MNIQNDADDLRRAYQLSAAHVTKVLEEKTAMTDKADFCIGVIKAFVAAKATDNHRAQLAFMVERAAAKELPPPEDDENKDDKKKDAKKK